MQFSSFSEFIAMGTHGFYVWLSYGFCFFVIATLIISCNLSTKQIKKQILSRQKREQKLKQAAEQVQQELE